jgi:predicted RNase H-like HicB family nuclease
MQVAVLIEQEPGNGFSAKAGDPFGFCAHGASRDEVLGKIREMIETRIRAKGTEVFQLEIPVAGDPWLRMKGMFKDDPLFSEWQRAIADYRRQVDEDPSIP